MNNIIYSAIIKEKHVILCEYTEYTGNFNQMLINFIKFIQNSSYKSFKSKIIIDNYQIFCIKDNFIYYVLFTSALEKNEENIFFSFLINIKNILLNKIPLNELKNKKPFSLKNFLPILKENILAFNKNNNKFVNNSNNEIISNLIEYQPKNYDENKYFFTILSKKKVHDENNNVDYNNMLLYSNKNNLKINFYNFFNFIILNKYNTNKTKNIKIIINIIIVVYLQHLLF